MVLVGLSDGDTGMQGVEEVEALLMTRHPGYSGEEEPDSGEVVEMKLRTKVKNAHRRSRWSDSFTQNLTKKLQTYMENPADLGTQP